MLHWFLIFLKTSNKTNCFMLCRWPRWRKRWWLIWWWPWKCANGIGWRFRWRFGGGRRRRRRGKCKPLL